MSVLPEELLRRLESDDEIEVVTYRADGTPRAPVPIWVVRVGDAAYRSKYARYAGNYLPPMLADQAVATTLRVTGT